MEKRVSVRAAQLASSVAHVTPDAGKLFSKCESRLLQVLGASRDELSYIWAAAERLAF